MFSKKIVAGAALLALAAAAQAGVNVYGALDLSFGSYKTPGGKSVTKVDSGNMMTSFIGFSGSEDLGGGLKAEFALESFIAPDTGSAAAVYNIAGGFWGRASNIALSGGFGKVAIGQYDNPFFTYGYTYNPFGSSMLFSPTMRHYYSLSLGNNNSGAALKMDTGWVNSLTYETPNMGGFVGVLQYSPKESSAAGAKDSFTLAGSYGAGPFSIGAAYATVGQAVAYGPEQKVFTLGASYDFTAAKLFGQYTSVNNDVANDQTVLQFGVSVPVSAQGSVLASWGQDKVKSNGGKDTIFSLGYDHFLSKRTDVYVGLTSEKATGKSNATSFAAGIKHAF
jgi:predicted porin